MKNKKLFAILTLVCFMFTLMPVAAFAATGDAETSSFVAVDGDQSISLSEAKNTGVEFELDLLAADGSAATATEVYFWAVNENGTVTSAFSMDEPGVSTAFGNVLKATCTTFNATIKFARGGEYTVYAGVANSANPQSVADLNKFECTATTIKVKDVANNPDKFAAQVTAEGTTSAWAYPGDIADVKVNVTPNNVFDDKVTVAFKYAEYIM